MTNVVIITGALTKDPTMRITPNNNELVRFTIACLKSYMKNEHNNNDFIKCSAWNKNAEKLICYAKKGTMLRIVGHLQSNSFRNKSGVMICAQEVVVEQLWVIDDYFDLSKLDVEELPFNTEED